MLRDAGSVDVGPASRGRDVVSLEESSADQSGSDPVTRMCVRWRAVAARRSQGPTPTLNTERAKETVRSTRITHRRRTPRDNVPIGSTERRRVEAMIWRSVASGAKTYSKTIGFVVVSLEGYVRGLPDFRDEAPELGVRVDGVQRRDAPPLDEKDDAFDRLFLGGFPYERHVESRGSALKQSGVADVVRVWMDRGVQSVPSVVPPYRPLVDVDLLRLDSHLAVTPLPSSCGSPFNCAPHSTFRDTARCSTRRAGRMDLHIRFDVPLVRPYSLDDSTPRSIRAPAWPRRPISGAEPPEIHSLTRSVTRRGVPTGGFENPRLRSGRSTDRHTRDAGRNSVEEGCQSAANHRKRGTEADGVSRRCSLLSCRQSP